MNDLLINQFKLPPLKWRALTMPFTVCFTLGFLTIMPKNCWKKKSKKKYMYEIMQIIRVQ